MKKLFFISCFCTLISFAGFSQVVYLADTAFTTDVGFGGAGASCIAPHLEYFGWQMGRVQGTWLADVFTVPADSVWAFDTVIVYGYQYGSGTTSTFLNCNLQIYNAAPQLGGAVIWGDTSTNVLVGTGWTGIYRVDTISAHGGLDATTRPIMYLKLYLATPPVLSAGTYWLSWSAAGSSSSIADAPDKVLPGRINPSGQMARQLYDGNWNYINDSSQTIGMDMIIKASASVAASVPTLARPSVSLSQNMPNPFSGSTAISFYMPQAGNAKLTVYNTIGQEIATLVDGGVRAGEQQVTFNGAGLPPGMYYYRLTSDAGTDSRQMLLVK